MFDGQTGGGKDGLNDRNSAAISCKVCNGKRGERMSSEGV